MNLSNELLILSFSTISIAFFHTILGPDHYLPFIVMSNAGKWSKIKTIIVTILCGLGHVGSSIFLGILGIFFGIALGHLEVLESIRGEIAAYSLIAFGLIYFIWGVNISIKNKIHSHEYGNSTNLTPWILFTIFIFGPCEPLIPLLMYPALKENLGYLIWIVSIFSIITIFTMLSVVLISIYGINLIPIDKIGRYAHSIAGFTILLCGLSIQFLGI